MLIDHFNSVIKGKGMLAYHEGILRSIVKKTLVDSGFILDQACTNEGVLRVIR